MKKKKNLIKINSRNDKNDDHLDGDVICAIQPSNIRDDSVLWIATRNGLIKYDMINDRFSRIVIDPTNPKGLSNISINDIYIKMVYELLLFINQFNEIRQNYSDSIEILISSL